MAVNVTLLTSGAENSGGDIVTASVDPSGPVLFGAFIGESITEALTPPTGLGLSWEQVAFITDGTGFRVLALWLGTGTPTEGQITLDVGANALEWRNWIVAEVSGGAAEVFDADNIVELQALTLTYPEVFAAGSGGFALFATNNNYQLTPAEGWTDLVGGVTGIQNEGCICAIWRPDADTAAGGTFPGGSSYYGLAIELLDAGAPPSNTRPATPTCSASATGETTAALTSSAFSDADGGDAHSASQWQVALSSDPTFASPVVDSGTDASNLVSRAITGLTAATEYIARVRHRDDSADAGTEWSEWSAASTAFTTDAAPSTTVAIDQSDPQSILVGGTVQLSATVANPSGSTSWASDDELVATVDASGEVTGIGVGSAEITATNNGVSDSITVNVGASVGSIADTVTLDGSPVEGATVWLINSTDGTLDSTTTDASGEFSFDNLPVGDEYMVAVQHESGGTQYSAMSKPFLTPS